MKKHLVVRLLRAAAMVAAIMMTAANTYAQKKTSHQVEATNSHRAPAYPQVGYQTGKLPPGHQTIRVNRDEYSYYNGSYYRPRPGGSYVVVSAPPGARVGSLPPGYVNFFVGPNQFFYANFTYYLWDQQRTEYVVVEEPAGAAVAVLAASEPTSSEIFVYPNNGQSDEQRGRDRYECYLWAVDQTGFDQTASNPDLTKAGDYRRALSACLEGRGYTVK